MALHKQAIGAGDVEVVPVTGTALGTSVEEQYGSGLRQGPGRLVARVVLPTPPFWLTIATTVIALLQPKRCWNGTDNALPSAANAGTVSISLASDASSGTTPVKTALSLRL